MKKWEKTLLAIFVLIIIVASGELIYLKSSKNKEFIADYGGVYIEGMVVDNKIDVEKVIQKLTKIGLTYFDHEGKIQAAIAENWEISDDGKTYTFYLRKNFNSYQIAGKIKTLKKGWSEIEIQTPEENIIQFILKEPYSPFLSSTAEPLFEAGPFVLKKQNSSEIIFEPRADFVFGKPYIEKLILKIYPNEENLVKAIKPDKISGFVTPEGVEIAKYTNYKIDLPRYNVLFFNLNREIFRDKEIRKKIKNSESIGRQINAKLATVDKESNIKKAEELKVNLATLGVNVDIIYYDLLELQKEILPKRDYDMLLYGLDYGYDPDPYPFWHSSQMASDGLNLSNFSNQKADTYMEEGRRIVDESLRKEKYQKFQEIFDEEVPAMILSKDTVNYSVSKSVKGVQESIGFSAADRFTEIWKWYIKEKKVKK